MGKPVVSIELDPGPWEEPEMADHREAGGTISGRVLLSTDEPVDCRKVVVEVGWRTEGRGDRDGEMCSSVTLHSGEIQPGDEAFPFEFDLPAGPMSYAGHYINIIWNVQARVDLAWKFDPVAVRQFFLTVT